MEAKTALARVRSLDVLRGLAILGMALSGLVPWDGLPAWMYHAQEPPPSHDTNTQIFGITWVDLVFPFFLFAMGAAIPLAVGKRLDQGETKGKVVLDTLKRGALLAVFAVVGQHFRPQSYQLGEWTSSGYLAGGFCFLLMCLAWAKWPKGTPGWVSTYGSRAGMAGTALLFLILPYHNPPHIDFHRFDVILMVLANVSVSGTLVWMATRNNVVARLACAAAVMAVFLTSTMPGPGKAIWDFLPFDAARYVYHFEYHKYLMVVIPGTVCGDLLVRLARRPVRIYPERAGAAMLAVLGLLLPAASCSLLMARQTMPLLGVYAAVGVVSMVILHEKYVLDAASRTFVQWGTALLLVGILVEGHGGGIRKADATLSYFLIPTGLAFWLMVSLLQMERRGLVRSALAWVGDVGANPMLAYIAITNLVPFFVHVLAISSAVDYFGPPTWFRMAITLGEVWLVGFVSVLATRRGFFLRA